nr:nuclear transport factor 2 family protein [Leptolyngbya sp. FACHB-321]
MPAQFAPDIELLRAAYAVFNARDIDAALALMTPNVAWSRAFKGSFVHVEPIAFYLEEDGQILVEVHQVVRDLAGAVLADEHVGHHFTLEQGLDQALEVCPPPASGLGASPRAPANRGWRSAPFCTPRLTAPALAQLLRMQLSNVIASRSLLLLRLAQKHSRVQRIGRQPVVIPS